MVTITPGEVGTGVKVTKGLIHAARRSRIGLMIKGRFHSNRMAGIHARMHSTRVGWRRSGNASAQPHDPSSPLGKHGASAPGDSPLFRMHGSEPINVGTDTPPPLHYTRMGAAKAGLHKHWTKHGWVYGGAATVIGTVVPVAGTIHHWNTGKTPKGAISGSPGAHGGAGGAGGSPVAPYLGSHPTGSSKPVAVSKPIYKVPYKKKPSGCCCSPAPPVYYHATSSRVQQTPQQAKQTYSSWGKKKPAYVPYKKYPTAGYGAYKYSQWGKKKPAKPAQYAQGYTCYDAAGNLVRN